MSPNQVVASLLELLMKNTCPKAETIEPRLMIWKLARGTHNILSQAPANVSPAPTIIYIYMYYKKMILTQILKPYLPSTAITKKFPGTNAIKNINV